MNAVRDALKVYQGLSFGDKLIFYTTLSLDMNTDKDTLPEILEEARPASGSECCYCHSLSNGSYLKTADLRRLPAIPEIHGSRGREAYA